MWEVVTIQEFDEWFASLSRGVRGAVAESLVLLRMAGPHLKRPHADTLKHSKHSNMKELRVDEGGQVIRIAFAFDPSRKAVVLVGGAKQGVKEKRFYTQLIRRADALYDEYLNSLPKRGGKK